MIILSLRIYSNISVRETKQDSMTKNIKIYVRLSSSHMNFMILYNHLSDIKKKMPATLASIIEVKKISANCSHTCSDFHNRGFVERSIAKKETQKKIEPLPPDAVLLVKCLPCSQTNRFRLYVFSDVCTFLLLFCVSFKPK